MTYEEAVSRFEQMYEASDIEDPKACIEAICEQLYAIAMGHTNAPIEQQAEAACVMFCVAYESPDEEGEGE